MSDTTKKLLIAALFAIAMAYVESAVVVYLRKIFYPEGFSFPMKIITDKIALIEIGRELATLVMLATVAWLAERRFFRWFMMLLFVWGVWDIFYYVWLKVFLDWPASLLTDDILFLIPVPWIGPVIAPVIVSLTFIAAALIFLPCVRCESIKPGWLESALTILGTAIILVSFLYDFFAVDLTSCSNPPFLWGVFLVGEALLIIAVIVLWRRLSAKK
jgi:hypothetical protein